MIVFACKDVNDHLDMTTSIYERVAWLLISTSERLEADVALCVSNHLTKGRLIAEWRFELDTAAVWLKIAECIFDHM